MKNDQIGLFTLYAKLTQNGPKPQINKGQNYKTLIRIFFIRKFFGNFSFFPYKKYRCKYWIRQWLLRYSTKSTSNKRKEIDKLYLIKI